LNEGCKLDTLGYFKIVRTTLSSSLSTLHVLKRPTKKPLKIRHLSKNQEQQKKELGATSPDIGVPA
jgi:hypothetical protein